MTATGCGRTAWIASARRGRHWLAPLAVACCLATPQGVRSEEASFAVSIGGIRAGTLAYEASETGGRYEARGSAVSSGLVGALYRARIDAAANGRAGAAGLRPDGYTERYEDPDEVVTRRISYRGGVPVVTREPPRRRAPRNAADPAAQSDTLDPMSAAYAILRDRPADWDCTLDIAVFDGARRTSLRFTGSEAIDGGLLCRGEYRRIAGFSPEDMAERQIWPVTLRTARRDDGRQQVTEIGFPTSFGAARLRRR